MMVMRKAEDGSTELLYVFLHPTYDVMVSTLQNSVGSLVELEVEYIDEEGNQHIIR